jgi:hypothetical protein
VDRVFLVGPPTAQLPALERKAIDVIKQSEVRQVVKLSAMGGRGAGGGVCEKSADRAAHGEDYNLEIMPGLTGGGVEFDGAGSSRDLFFWRGRSRRALGDA